MRGRSFRGAGVFLVLFLALTAVLLILGARYYKYYENQLKLRATEELTLTAQFKSSEISTWFQERLNDANILFTDAELMQLVRDADDSTTASTARQRLSQRLEDVQVFNNYTRVSIRSRTGSEISFAPDTSAAVEVIRSDSLTAILDRDELTLWGIHRHSADGELHLSLLVPLKNRPNSTKPCALLVLVISPERYLYPVVDFWPITTRSAETMLVRRDGDLVTFLNPLRFDSTTTLLKKVPVNALTYPAALAVSGERGLVEGTDYRGEPVLAYVTNIPETPWYMVAKIDKAEVLAPMRERLAWLIFQLGVIVIAIGLGIGLFWRNRRAVYYREQLALAEQLQMAQQSATTMLRSIGDAVIATDREGLITQINPVAERLTGWTERDALGKPLAAVFQIINQLTREPLPDPVQKVIVSHEIIELANHTLLISRSGREYHIADSAAPIRKPGGEIEGVILTFRDETEKYLARETIRESRRQLAGLINNLPGMVYHCNNDPTWTMLYVSAGARELTGYSPDDFIDNRKIAYGDIIHLEDQDYVWNTIQEALEKDKSYTLMYRITSAGGDERWVWERGSGVFNDQGALQRLEGFITDITAEKIAEDAIRESEERYRLIWDSAKDGMRLTDAEGIVVEVNQAFCDMVKLSKEEVEGKPLSVMYRQDHDHIIRKHQERFQERTIPGRHTQLLQLHNGEKRWFEISNAYVRFPDKPEYVLCVFRDITERKQAEVLRQQIENQYHQLFNSIRDAILVADTDRKIIDCNAAFTELFGYALDDIKGKRTVTVYQSPDEFETMGAELRNHMDELGFVTTIHYQKKSGDSFVGETSAQYIRDGEGNAAGFLALIRDVTEREALLAELRRSEAHNRDLIETSQDFICTHTLDGRLLSVNPAVVRLSGYTESELLKMNLKDILSPEYREYWDAYIATIEEQGHAEGFMSVRSKSGQSYVWEYRNTLRTDGVSEPIVRGIGRDVTEQRRMEKTLRESEERFRTLYDNTTIGLYRTMPDGQVIMANPTLIKLLGHESFDELSKINLNETGFSPNYPREEFVRRMAEEGLVQGMESQWTRRDGSSVFVRESARAVRDANGKILYYDGSVEDITDRKRLENQLLQAQKMEGIGRLAGGIAHDFNNVLTIINGYSELLMMELSEDSKILPKIKDIHDAGRRAASLTQHLLAFSRKQILEMRVVNINTVISGAEKLLRKLIGEDIELGFLADSHVWPVKLDTGQFEQVILNLALNARDAMPRGGKLTIETQNVTLETESIHLHGAIPVGEYVRIALSDTGIGMDQAVLNNIFEPFFTTKAKGKGTGLGLSTVFGIINQSSGFITVYSEPSAGTTFKIYLPRAMDEVQENHDKPESKIATGSETILLAEDEEKVREITRTMLEAAGYTVLPCDSITDALEQLRDEAVTIDLLLTDVVMPEMSGKELGEIARESRPNLPVIYMSGYTDNVIGLHGVLEEGSHFIGKPFSPAELARKVRQVLDLID